MMPSLLEFLSQLDFYKIEGNRLLLQIIPK